MTNHISHILPQVLTELKPLNMSETSNFQLIKNLVIAHDLQGATVAKVQGRIVEDSWLVPNESDIQEVLYAIDQNIKPIQAKQLQVGDEVKIVVTAINWHTVREIQILNKSVKVTFKEGLSVELCATDEVWIADD